MRPSAHITCPFHPLDCAKTQKTLEARKAIERAKGVLMKQQGLSEPEAFSLIQKKSMDLRKPMVEIAQAIILSEEIKK